MRDLIVQEQGKGMYSMTTRTGRASVNELLNKYGDKIFDGRGGSNRKP